MAHIQMSSENINSLTRRVCVVGILEDLINYKLIFLSISTIGNKGKKNLPKPDHSMMHFESC